jgi:hypothetical protein
MRAVGPDSYGFPQDRGVVGPTATNSGRDSSTDTLSRIDRSRLEQAQRVKAVRKDTLRCARLHTQRTRTAESRVGPSVPLRCPMSGFGYLTPGKPIVHSHRARAAPSNSSCPGGAPCGGRSPPAPTSAKEVLRVLTLPDFRGNGWGRRAFPNSSSWHEPKKQSRAARNAASFDRRAISTHTGKSRPPVTSRGIQPLGDAMCGGIISSALVSIRSRGRQLSAIRTQLRPSLLSLGCLDHWVLARLARRACLDKVRQVCDGLFSSQHSASSGQQ